MVTWADIVEEAAGRLSEARIPDPEVSARWIGQEATGSDGADWLDVLRSEATQRQLASFDRMVERRLQGEPLQYVLGSWGFRSLELFIDARVLIPRPETEIVAKRAIDEARRLLAAPEPGPDPGSESSLLVADLGTGSGAIGLSVAREVAGTDVWLTDVSSDALAVARANLAGLGQWGGSVRLAQGSWFKALPQDLVGRFGLVVSNPPYVSSVEDLEPQVAAWEPSGALMAAENGRADLLHLLAEGPGWLRADGALVLEMAPDQIEEMVSCAGADFAEVDIVIDLAERQRAIVCRYPKR